MRCLFKQINLQLNPLKNMDEIFTTKKHKKLSLDSINNELLTFFNKCFIEVHSIDIFHTAPGKRGPQHDDSIHVCHIDGSADEKLIKHGEWPLRCKINFIFAEKGADMIWWEPKSFSKISSCLESINKPPYVNPYVQWNIDDCEIICQENLNGVYLVETGIPHSVWNNSNTDRYAVSFAITATNSNLQFDMQMDKIYNNLSLMLSSSQ